MNKTLLVGGFLVLSACAYNSQKPQFQSPSKEPFNIKTNDSVGVRLGMTVSEYKANKNDCLPEDANEEMSCTVTRTEGLTVGGAPVTAYYLRFYKKRIIEIEYRLASLDFDPMRRALEEKFGPSNKYDSGPLRW